MQRRVATGVEVGTHALMLRYSAIALGALGCIEWLLGRTVSRMAASPTLDGTLRAIVEAFGQVGIRLLPLAFIAATLRREGVDVSVASKPDAGTARGIGGVSKNADADPTRAASGKPVKS